ncbi:unnamed protein product [Chironomus riparius]|uniref:Uncharacterized protein n=1 Tax=Chironomus riparius TaxID=315576 RepID=A0A9N9WYJ1_9DIPT|nr:unnamed protein product [Chironomus riparius]
MKLTCTYEDFTFNTGEVFYQCIIKDQEALNEEDYEFSGQHLTKKYDPDVTFVEFRDCNCPKVPQGLTKTFPNLKVLSICNSKLKDISKDDMAEYKNLQRFICDQNEVDFLPGDLFEGFKDLNYIKFTNNKLGVIEPNLLSGVHKLQYVNFKSNPSIHKFAANSQVYNRSINTTLWKLRWFLTFNFLSSDQKFIRNYALKCPDPNKAIDLLKECANGYESKMNLLDVRYDVYEERRAKDVAELKAADEKLTQRVAELEASNTKLHQEIEEMEGLRMKLSQQLEEYKKEVEKEKEGNIKLKKSMQSQIDNLVQQFQSIMFNIKSQ